MDYLFIIYGLPIIALVITLIAQGFVSSSYSKYSKVKNERGITGKEAARYLLDKNGLSEVDVVETTGYLTDHYDPRSKVIKLSYSTKLFSKLLLLAISRGMVYPSTLFSSFKKPISASPISSILSALFSFHVTILDE